MNNTYARAYTELYEILKNIPKEEFNKIPKEILQMLEEKRDKSYQFQLKENIEFEQQSLLRETKVLLAILFRDYWATEDEREKIIQKWRYDIQSIEQEKAEKYNPNDLFKKKNIEPIQEEKTELPIEYKEKFYQKIINFFKKLLKI